MLKKKKIGRLISSQIVLHCVLLGFRSPHHTLRSFILQLCFSNIEFFFAIFI